MTDSSLGESTAKQFMCPVCNTLLENRNEAVKVDHGAHAHFFCSDVCRGAFEKDPKKYH